MIRKLTASAVVLTLVATVAFSQDGPLRRAGRAIDNAGKNIRGRVEAEIDRGEVVAEERDMLHRVIRRIEWDKKLQGSTLRIESRADGVVVLQGSVVSDEAKARAVDLASSTIGVASVIDEIAVVKEVKVIESRPGATVIEVVPPVPADGETKGIVKP